MLGNCNHTLHEGGCDEACKNASIKSERYNELTNRKLRDSLAKIRNRPLALHEMQEVLIHILDRLDHIDN